MKLMNFAFLHRGLKLVIMPDGSLPSMRLSSSATGAIHFGQYYVPNQFPEITTRYAGTVNDWGNFFYASLKSDDFYLAEKSAKVIDMETWADDYLRKALLILLTNDIQFTLTK